MSITVSHLRRLVQLTGAALAVAAGLLVAGPASSASALASVNGPAGFSCDSSRAQIVVSPPRAWASYRSEQVTWVTAIERWNPNTQSWYTYATYQNWATFTSQGWSATSWSVYNNTRGGMYVNNYMRYPVYHQGYYRVASAINGNQGGVYWAGYVAGGAYCYIS
jgi:hypothetical protein